MVATEDLDIFFKNITESERQHFRQGILYSACFICGILFSKSMEYYW